MEIIIVPTLANFEELSELIKYNRKYYLNDYYYLISNSKDLLLKNQELF